MKKWIFVSMLVWAGVAQGMRSIGSESMFGLRKSEMKVPSPQKEDLWITDTLVIQDTTWYQWGNIWVCGSGVLKVMSDAELHVCGWVLILDDGKVLIDSSYLHLLSLYSWQLGIGVCNHGILDISNSSLFYNFQPAFIMGKDDGRIKIRDTYIWDFTTFDYFERAYGEFTNISGLMGEHFFLDSNSIEFSNVEQLNFALQFPYGSVADLSITPYSDFIEHWRFDSLTPGVSGIPYSVVVDSSHNVAMGPWTITGSDVTLRDSDSIHIMVEFSQPDTIDVTGLMNRSLYADSIMPFTDRNLRLINTTISNWHFYAHSTSVLTLEDCVFTELLLLDTTDVTVRNCTNEDLFAGTSLYNNPLLYAEESNFLGPVRMSDSAKATFSHSTISGAITADVNSKLVLLNTTFSTAPLILSAATVYCASIDEPDSGGINDSIQIQGSAWIDGGPESTHDFDGYRLSYASDSLGPWILINNWQTNEIRDSVLGIWNTSGLESGDYLLQLWLKDDSGDSVATYRAVKLLEAGVEEESNGQLAMSNWQLSIHPNPATHNVVVEFVVRGSEFVDKESLTLKIHDLSGRLVRSFQISKSPNHQIAKSSWDGRDNKGKAVRSGMYFVKLKAGDEFSKTKKLLFLR